MTTLITQLPNIRDVDPLGPADEALFQKIRRVLDEHNALHRFGIVLLHQHFSLREGERLAEFVDAEQRTLTIKPVQTGEPRAINAIETQWRLDQPTPMLGCEQWCYEDPATGEHLDTGHQKTEDEDDD